MGVFVYFSLTFAKRGRKVARRKPVTESNQPKGGNMLGTILVWIGALGVGVFFGLLVLIVLSVQTLTDKALVRLATLAGGVSWVLAAKTHLYVGEPHWPWLMLYVGCWACGALAGLLLYAFSYDPTEYEG